MFGSKNKLGDGQYIYIPKRFMAEACAKLNENYLKVYVYARFLAAENGGFINGQVLINELKMDSKVISDAIEILVNMGYMSLSEGGIIAFPESRVAENSNLEQKPRYLPGEVAAYIERDSQLTDLVEAAQIILGKMLSNNAISVLYSLYDWLGLSPDVIIKVLEYCAELGKKSMSYIESVAIAWQKAGIVTVDDADNYIENELSKRNYVYKVKKALGITGRNFTPREEEYVRNWEQMGVSLELLNYAFEYCVACTGKLAFPYMDKVLLSWKNSGISTAAEAEESVKLYSAKAKTDNQTKSRQDKKTRELKVFDGKRYNESEIDKLARRKMRETLK